MKGAAMRQMLIPCIGVAAVFLIMLSGRGIADHPRAPVAEASMFDLSATQDPALMRAAMLGYESAVSSMIWTGAIMEFADQILTGNTTKALRMSLETVVCFDSAWRYPYEFAGIVLEDSGHRPDPVGLKILEQGVRRFPEDAHLAILYSQILLGAPWIDSSTRFDSAAKVLLPLSSGRIKAPEFARTLGFTLMAREQGGLKALQQMLYVWEQERDPLIRYTFSQKLPNLLEQATGLKGDSLNVACEGIRRMVGVVAEDGKPGMQDFANTLVVQLADSVGRGKAYAVLAKAAAIPM